VKKANKENFCKKLCINVLQKMIKKKVKISKIRRKNVDSKNKILISNIIVRKKVNNKIKMRR